MILQENGFTHTKAEEMSYVRPEVSEGRHFNIVGGRHPVVEHFLKNVHQKFTPNNLRLNEGISRGDASMQLITASNMAGKSTFLRQNALISLMAQAGSFVPASFAKFGIIDKLFARVGASDDITKNLSTFMVEMLECAHILKNATVQSFVIMDEVGRGTSPWCRQLHQPHQL